MTSGARGEGIIETDSGEVRVLYTARALAEAETKLGRGILGVLNEFTSGVGGGYTEISVLLQAGMEAARRDSKEGGKAISIMKAYKLIDEVGLTTAIDVVMTAVATAISYSRNGADVDDDDEDEDDPNA